MKKYLTIFLGLLLVILVWNSVTPANVNFPYSLLTMFLGEEHTWTAKQTFNSGIGFSDGTSQTTAGGSGTASPAGSPGSVQYNASGTLNGESSIKVDVKSGVTTVWGLVGGVSVYAMNWQGYQLVLYKNGVTDEVRHATTGVTKYFDDGAAIKEKDYNNSTTAYYSTGGMERIKWSSGVTDYDAVGNVREGIDGWHISEIDINGDIATAGTMTANKARTGVSSASGNQLTAGVSLFPNTAWGSIMYINSATFTNIALPAIGSGSTEYAQFVVMGGGGVSICSTGDQRFFTAGSASATNAVTALYIPAGSYLHDVTIFGVSGYQVGGVTEFWRYKATSAVSGL